MGNDHQLCGFDYRVVCLSGVEVTFGSDNRALLLVDISCLLFVEKESVINKVQ